MFKKYLFIIIVSLICVTTKAQNVEWSNPQKLKAKTLYSQIIGESTAGIYLLKCRDTDFESSLTIEKYKSNLALETSVDLPVSINGIIERVLLIDNFIYAFITAKNSNTGNIDLLVQKIDENLKAIGAPSLLGTIESSNFIEKRHIQIKTSADKNRIAIMFLTKNNAESNLNLWVYNRQLVQSYAKQFSISKPAKEIFITNYEVSNNGETYLLIDYPNGEGKKNVYRDFYLYGYTPITDKMLQYHLNEEYKSIEDLSLNLNNYNKVVNVFGFYTKLESKNIEGQFNVRVNISNALMEHKSFIPIDFGVFYKGFTSKIGDKQNELNNFYLRKIISKSDGGVIAIAEKYFQTRQVYTYYTNNFPQTSTRTIYNFDEVALLNISPTGQLLQNSWLKKNQSSTNDGGYLSSIVVTPTTDNIFIIYNQDNGSDNDIMLCNLNFQGKFDTKILAKNANFSAAVIPAENKQTGANTVLICAIKDKRFSLMRITF